jgi:3-hydroxyisobutyrate dehydrogenase-like beta-hydroxyacid dehydrogenase
MSRFSISSSAALIWSTAAAKATASHFLAHKDISHALTLGNEVGSPLMLGAISREMFALAIPWGRGNEDWTAMLLLMEDLGAAGHLPPSDTQEPEAL